MDNNKGWDTATPSSWPQKPVEWPTAAQPQAWPVATPEPQPAKLDDPIPEPMKERLTVERLPVTAEGVLMLWERQKKALTELKNDELEIRKLAVKVYVPNAHEGINNIPLAEGYTLKAQIKFNYTLDSDNDKVEAALDKIATIGNEGPFIAERIVSWTPNFLLTEYRKLQEDADKDNDTAQKILKIISEVLTISDGAPTLEIKEPKVKKK